MSGSDSLAMGFSCPQKGAFYVCAGSDVRFVGCCQTDPCANGGVCAGGNLGTTTFSADNYDEIPPQNCSDGGGGGGAAWYTCKFTSPPFLGCCVSNPCASDPGGCPGRDLRAARLSDNDVLAGPFLASSSTGSSSSSSSSGSSSTARKTATTTSALASTRSAASSPTASAAAAPSSSSLRPAAEEASSNFPAGAVAGVAAGGFALLVVIGCLAWRLRRQGRRARAAEIQSDQMTVARGPGNPPPPPPPSSPYSPYKESCTSNPTVVGSSPVSPPTAAWSPQSPLPGEGWASPGPERAASARPLSELAGSEIGYNDGSVRGSRAR